MVWIPVWTTGCRKWIKPQHLDGKVIPSCSSLPLLFWWLALSYLHQDFNSRCPAFVTVSWLSLSSFRHSISALLLSCLCRRILFNLYILAALHILGSLCVLRAPQDLVTLLSCPTCDWILLHFLFYMCNRILVHFCPIWATDLGSLCFCPTGVPGP